MLYWDGTAWISVASGTDGQTLTFIGGRPVWSGSLPANTVVNSTTGKIWMDRNLGASQVATSSKDAAAYGDLYQWGRGTDGHQLRNSNTTSTLSINDQPADGNFITSSGDWRSTRNTNLWQGVNGVNNPCPTGYRIPTAAEWQAERLSWTGGNNDAGALASPLKLPLAGARYSPNGAPNAVGEEGRYWSSTANTNTSSKYLYFSERNTGASVSDRDRAFGYSVRCLKD